MRGFEPPTPRPPDVYSNRAELHPETNSCKTNTNKFNSLNIFTIFDILKEDRII